jgi:hypothetical protein
MNADGAPPHRGAHASTAPIWATPVLVGGGIALLGGLVIVGSCGPADPAQHGRVPPGRTLVGYRGVF